MQNLVVNQKPGQSSDLLSEVVRQMDRALRPSNSILPAAYVSGREIENGYDYMLDYYRWHLRVRVTALFRPAAQVVVLFDIRDSRIPEKLKGWQRVYRAQVNGPLAARDLDRLLFECHGDLLGRRDVWQWVMGRYTH